MAEIVGAFLRADLWDEGANSSIEGRNSSGSELAQERLEFAVRHLNRIKIRGVLWKVADYRPRFLNRLPNAGPQVDSAVIHHHDVIAPGAWVPSTARHMRGTSLPSWHPAEPVPSAAPNSC